MKIKSLLIAALAFVSLNAVANTAATDKIYAENATIAKTGETVVIPVKLANQTGYAALQADFTLDEGLTLVKQHDDKANKDMFALLNYNGRAKSHTLAEGQPNGAQSLRIVMANLQNTTIATGDDEVIYLKVQGTKDGEFKVKINKVHYSTGVASEQGKNDGDGPETVFTIKVANSGVNSVTTAKEVANVTYINVAGVQSNVPFEGINIVKTQYTDGTTSISKIVK